MLHTSGYLRKVGIECVMRSCPVCGDTIGLADNDGPLCFRCKDSGAQIRLEIYDKDPYANPEDSFAKVFMGDNNFRDMQKKYIHRGGFS